MIHGKRKVNLNNGNFFTFKRKEISLFSKPTNTGILSLSSTYGNYYGLMKRQVLLDIPEYASIFV